MEDLENDAKLAILLQEEERNAITVNDSLIAAFYQQEIDKSNSLKNETSYVAQPIVRETTQIHIDAALAQTIQLEEEEMAKKNVSLQSLSSSHLRRTLGGSKRIMRSFPINEARAAESKSDEEEDVMTLFRLQRPSFNSNHSLENETDTSDSVTSFALRPHHHIFVPVQHRLHRINGRRSFNDDPNSSTYEELLELGERIGNASDAGLNSNVIRSLPKICYAKPSDTSAASSLGLSDSDNMCYVCRENFETNEMLRCLPCCHRFHIKCIDTWLKQKGECPVCRCDIKEELKRR